MHKSLFLVRPGASAQLSFARSSPFSRKCSGQDNGVPGWIYQRCFDSYGDKSWYDKVLRGGWPDIKGDVRLGIPTKNKFGEIVVITLTDTNHPHVTVFN